MGEILIALTFGFIVGFCIGSILQIGGEDDK